MNPSDMPFYLLGVVVSCGAMTFGLLCGVKWSGYYDLPRWLQFLTCCAFIVVLVVIGVARRMAGRIA